MAQLVARFVRIEEVRSSNLLSSTGKSSANSGFVFTMFRRLAQLDRASWYPLWMYIPAS
jgi:hypothetical protein